MSYFRIFVRLRTQKLQRIRGLVPKVILFQLKHWCFWLVESLRPPNNYLVLICTGSAVPVYYSCVLILYYDTCPCLFGRIHYHYYLLIYLFYIFCLIFSKDIQNGCKGILAVPLVFKERTFFSLQHIILMESND